MAARAVRGLAATLAICGVTWWLFADTVGHWRGEATSPAAEIRFAHFGTYQDYQTWAQVIDRFEQRHPQWRVRQEYVVGTRGAYTTKLRQQILSKTLPHVFLMQAGPFPHLAEHFADLSERVDADRDVDLSQLPSTGLTLFTHNGRLRGLPVSGGNLLIYCNPDCFAKASRHHNRPIALPEDDWTLADFRELAELLTCDFDADGTLDQFGFWQPSWLYYLPMLWSRGADVLDETGTTWRFTGDEAEAALAYYQQMRIGRRVSPRPDEVAQMFQDVGFLTGTTAMCINGPWFQPFLAETGLANRYHVAHIPNGPAGRQTRVTWDAACMPANLTPQASDKAWAFLSFIVSEEAQRILASTHRAIPALSIAAPAFAENDPTGACAKFVDALVYSRLEPRTPWFRELDQAMHDHWADLVRDDDPITPKQCLTNLANDKRIAEHFEVGAP